VSAEPLHLGSPSISMRPLSGEQAVTRERILDAARDLARTGGYEAVGMRALADRAGVSAPTAYKYFASRDHVLVELLVHLNAATNAAILARPSRRADPIDRAVATLRRAVRFVEEEPLLFCALIRAYNSGAPQVRHANGAMQSSMRVWIDSALQDAEIEDRRVVVSILESVMFSGMVGLVSGGNQPSDVADNLERVARFVLNHCRSAETSGASDV
jgi:AcrR family transcriptional regulator